MNIEFTAISPAELMIWAVGGLLLAIPFLRILPVVGLPRWLALVVFVFPPSVVPILWATAFAGTSSKWNTSTQDQRAVS